MRIGSWTDFVVRADYSADSVIRAGSDTNPGAKEGLLLKSGARVGSLLNPGTEADSEVGSDTGADSGAGANTRADSSAGANTRADLGDGADTGVDLGAIADTSVDSGAGLTQTPGLEEIIVLTQGLQVNLELSHWNKRALMQILNPEQARYRNQTGEDSLLNTGSKVDSWLYSGTGLWTGSGVGNTGQEGTEKTGLATKITGHAGGPSSVATGAWCVPQFWCLRLNSFEQHDIHSHQM